MREHPEHEKQPFDGLIQVVKHGETQQKTGRKTLKNTKNSDFPAFSPASAVAITGVASAGFSTTSNGGSLAAAWTEASAKWVLLGGNHVCQNGGSHDVPPKPLQVHSCEVQTKVTPSLVVVGDTMAVRHPC